MSMEHGIINGWARFYKCGTANLRSEMRTDISKEKALHIGAAVCRVQMYWNIGKTIFEEEQQGQERAEYGAYLIKGLSFELEPQFGTGKSSIL